jgi:type I restriction enzyme, S subunit
MAKTLYDYWFVQFDFPDANGKLYKTNGGKMVWNEELKREIPERWEVRELGDMLSLEYGKPLKEEDRVGGNYPVLGSNGIVGYHNEYLIEGSGIVVGRKGTAGAVVWVEDSFYPIDTSFYVKDKINVGKLYFHYFLLVRSNLQKIESSSAVPGLNRNSAYSIKTVMPEKSIIQNFQKIVEPIFSKTKICNAQNQRLASLRDWLLPMLMNGQVRVSSEAQETAGANQPGQLTLAF